MLTHRNVNIFFLVFILIWVWLDRQHHVSPAAYGWILLVYVSVLFCGSYFIQLGFFFKSLNAGTGSERQIALSFDDGPHPAHTAEILDLLKEKKLETTFFCIGKNIAGNEALLRRMVEEGHVIGNHSYSHDVLFDLYSPSKMLNDLQAMNTAVATVTGLTPRLFRPPYGVTNPNLRKAVQRGGFVSIGWSVRSMDTVIRDGEKLKKKVLRGLKPGAILLFHDSSHTTITILNEIVDEIQLRGYRIVRLDKMLKLEPYA